MDRETSTNIRSKKRRTAPTERGTAARRARLAGAGGHLGESKRAERTGARRAANDPCVEFSRTSTMVDERWDSLLKCTPDLVVVVDRKGMVLRVNHLPKALAANGEGIVGHSIYEFLTSEHCARVRECIECVFQNGKTVKAVVCFRTHAGCNLCSEAYIGPVVFHGQIVAVGMFLADISERERLQARLREREVLLRSIVRAVPKMVEIMEGLLHHAADVSESRRRVRELELCRRQMAEIGRLASVGSASSGLTQRLPQFLTTIGISIENALAKLDAATRCDGVGSELEAALRSVSALAAGFEQVRNFAETGARKPLVHAVDLRAALANVVQLLELRARGADTVICIDDRNEWPQVLMTEGDAEQLVFCLLEKLLTLTDGRRHHRIVIDATVAGDRVELRLAGDDDFGMGPGSDASSGRAVPGKRAVSGVDLGLYVAQDIVGRSGGTMRCEEVAGAGRMFVIRLQMAKRMGTELSKSGRKR